MTGGTPGKFLPGCHLIEGFGGGGFRFGGMSHQGSLLIVPSGMRALMAATIADVTVADLAVVVAEKGDIDFLLIGVGVTMAPCPQPLRKYLLEQAINFEVMDTRAAVRTYNVLRDEERRVAASLIAVND